MTAADRHLSFTELDLHEKEGIAFMLAEAARRGYGRCRLHAQAHLVDLYRRHGFAPQGETFYEAGIPHRLMTRQKASPGDASPT